MSVAVGTEIKFPAHTSTRYPDFEKLVGREGWNRLCPAIQNRFTHHDKRTNYPGQINCKANLIGRIFAILLIPFGNPLPNVRDKNYQARVDVFPDNRGGVVWKRIFKANNAPDIMVQSTKKLASNGGLLECIRSGRLGQLSMKSRVYEMNGTLCFESDAYSLTVLKLGIPVPHLFTPGKTLVEHIDLGNGEFRFRMTMVHKWFGKTVIQDGVFRDAG